MQFVLVRCVNSLTLMFALLHVLINSKLCPVGEIHNSGWWQSLAAALPTAAAAHEEVHVTPPRTSTHCRMCVFVWQVGDLITLEFGCGWVQTVVWLWKQLFVINHWCKPDNMWTGYICRFSGNIMIHTVQTCGNNITKHSILISGVG